MRQLTFPGFLDRYVRQLSDSHTGALHALAREAAKDNPRLREPLYLYALSTGREQILLRASAGTEPGREYERMHRQYSYPDLLAALQADPCPLPEGYRKVWRSYQSEAGAYERDARVKALMRQRIMELQKELAISTYRICRDLNLNNPNINAWLKHGADEKVALDTARRILTYLTAMTKQ